MKSQFNKQKVVLATMHGKEKIIASLLKEAFDMECFLAPGINTDLFGTFTGEVKRRGDMLEAARLKIAYALENTDYDFALASEGSFGPDSKIPFINSNFELVLLYDKTSKREFIGHYKTTGTNFDGQYVSNPQEALDFANKIGFPDHGLILRIRKGWNKYLKKDIQTEEEFITSLNNMLRLPLVSKVYLETDMRAHRNPTRMKAIGEATKNLIEKMKSLCPHCHTPGFIVKEFEGNIHCTGCGNPTSTPRYQVFICEECGWREKKDIANYQNYASPEYCNYCNP